MSVSSVLYRSPLFKHFPSLLNAKIKFVVHGPDALTIAHRAAEKFGIPQHILVPKASVGLASRILSQQHGYNIFNNPPFPSCAEDVRVYRPSTALADGNSATVVLSHPDPEYEGAPCLFVHPSSNFHFDLDDPSKTLTLPNPSDPSLVGVRFPTEVAFVDSLVDTYFDPPPGNAIADCTPRCGPQFVRWLWDFLGDTLCEYPNEYEYFNDLGDDEGYDDHVWREGKRPWGNGFIPAREYILRMIKEENRFFTSLQLRINDRPEAPLIPMEELAAMRSKIIAAQKSKLVVATPSFTEAAS